MQLARVAVRRMIPPQVVVEPEACGCVLTAVHRSKVSTTSNASMVSFNQDAGIQGQTSLGYFILLQKLSIPGSVMPSMGLPRDCPVAVWCHARTSDGCAKSAHLDSAKDAAQEAAHAHGATLAGGCLLLGCRPEAVALVIAARRRVVRRPVAPADLHARTTCS